MACTLPGTSINTAKCQDAVAFLTDVGDYPNAASPSGTFDPGGNAAEWNDAIITGTFRGLRGGSFSDVQSETAASFQSLDFPTDELAWNAGPPNNSGPGFYEESLDWARREAGPIVFENWGESMNEPANDPELLRWETLTKKRFDEIDRERAVVLVTCSPLEVHGPHLPFGADCFEGEALSERMLRFLPDVHRKRTFLKLPFIYAASDPVPQPGSIGFRVSTILAMLEDLGHSLATQGFKNVVVSNFHGSPRHFLAIETACDRVSKQHGIKMVGLFSLMLSRLEVEGSELGHVLGHLPGVEPEDFVGDIHGGLVETSQLLAIAPDLVDPEFKTLPRRDVERWLEDKGESKPEVEGMGIASLPAMLAGFKAGLHYFTEESYSGHPSLATAELGEAFLDVLGAKAAEAMADLLEGRLKASECHSPVWKLRHLFVNKTAIQVSDWILNNPKTVG